MPRPARQDILGDGDCTVHLTIRCHDKRFLLADDQTKQLLYNLLKKHKSDCNIKIHHYVFMDNHFHIVLHAAHTHLLSRFMSLVFSSLARFVNKRLQRSGRVFGERARTPVIMDRKYMFCVMRYIDFNPVRANIADKPHLYKWSSYRHYAFGEPDELIDDAPDYLDLSPLPPVRRKMYRQMLLRLEARGRHRLPEMVTWFFIGDSDWILLMLKQRGLLPEKKKPPG